MRVLFLTTALAPDEPSPAGQLHAAWLRDLRRHHVVDVVAGYRRDRRLIPSQALGVDLCGKRGIGAAWALRRAAWRRARSFGPDVVVTTAPAAPRCGVPAVALLAELPDIADRLTGRAALSRLGGFARVLVTAEPVRDALIELGLPGERVLVSPPGAAPVRPARAPSDTLHLLCSGPIGPVHGQHLAIDAVSRLSPVEKARVHLRITGHVEDAVYLGHLRVQAHGQPVALQPDAAGPTDPLASADLLLALPLRAPTSHLALASALVSGIPAAWADVAGMQGLTEGLGTPVPSNDVLAVRDLIRRMLDGDQDIVEEAQAAAEIARAKLGLASAEARLKAVLDEIMEGAG